MAMLFISTPQSHFVRQATVKGSLLARYKLCVQCRTPSRSDRFNGVTGVQGGLRGEIEIFPGPLQKDYKEAYLLFVCFTPSENSLTANFHLPLRGSLWGGAICQDIGVNAQVGTRSPYSLPFVILPVPARSPFRFIRHRRRSTPNLTQNSKNVHLFAPRDLWLWGENCCIMLASARRYASALKKGYTHEKIA